MNYKKVYEFMVEEEVEKGKDVYCLDKQEKEVLHVNVLGFEYTLKLIRDAKDNNRYEFWTEKKDSPVVFKKFEKFGEDLFPQSKDVSVKEDTNNA